MFLCRQYIHLQVVPPHPKRWFTERICWKPFVMCLGILGMKRVTVEYKLSQDELYPGAGYQLQVFAISHNLYSEPHDYFQAVCKSQQEWTDISSYILHIIASSHRRVEEWEHTKYHTLFYCCNDNFETKWCGSQPLWCGVLLLILQGYLHKTVKHNILGCI